MLIDRSHKPWGIATVAILVVAVAIYVPSALGSTPPSGGSLLGLVYGIAGFGAMAVVTLLALRKKFPIWRIGRTKVWMRAHLWLGALSLPLILMHAGFLFGHPTATRLEGYKRSCIKRRVALQLGACH